MKASLERVLPDWPTVLERVVGRLKELGPKALVVFDLDSTLFDNRPRQARIVRAFGAEHGVPELLTCQAHHFPCGWELEPALRSCGVDEARTQALLRPLKAYWGQRFFTSDACQHDVEVLGAPRYVQRCLGTGARVVYVTGRIEPMREGTERALAKCGLPLPGGQVGLMMRPPQAHLDDAAFKRTAHEVLAELGELVAAFDNEPRHVNDYARRFPGAVAVHLATDHSGKSSALDARVVSIPHFAW